MRVEQVPDQPGRRGMHERAWDDRADQASGGGSLKKSPVRERLSQAGGEVAVPDAVGAGEAVIPGQVGSVEVSHRVVAAAGGDEPVHRAAIPLAVGGGPLVASLKPRAEARGGASRPR